MTAAALEGEFMTAAEVAAAESAGATETELRNVFSLKEQAAVFADAFSNLLSWESEIAGTDLEPEYRKLVDRGFALRDRIASLMASVDAALRWAKGLFGADDAKWSLGTWLYDITHPNEGMSGALGRTLGVVWFIPVAAIVAVLGVIGYWLADYAKFAKRFAEQQRIAQELVAQGLAPVEANRQAAAAVAGTTPGFFKPLGDALPWIAVAGGGFLLWRWWRAH